MADDEPEFRTAADLREEAGNPTFDIPARPDRRYPSFSGLRYEGETVFTLVPEPSREDERLAALVERVLASDHYRYGDWFDLPMPLYLVHDDGTGDTFRVAVRDGTVELHVLSQTEPAGLRALYERLDRASDCAWTVERRTG